MTQTIETEHLARCPFCGGKAELRVADHPIDENRKVAKVVCLQCNACTSGFSTGKDFFTGKETTLDEVVKKAAGTWNRRPNAEIWERERERYANSLSVAEVGQILEADKLWKYSTWKEIRFCRNMSEMYCCKPLSGDGDNFNNFLVTLYHYGTVQGIRQERARKRKRRQVGHEVTEIAKALNENHLLYQVMKTAVEVQSAEAVKQAVDFLKGAKKNED